MDEKWRGKSRGGSGRDARTRKEVLINNSRWRRNSRESEIYRCNDPRQGRGEVFSQPGGKLTSLRDREREMCGEKSEDRRWRTGQEPREAGQQVE